MKKAQANKWIKALRSGKFTQAQGGLLVEDHSSGTKVEAHCCLGVLARINGYSPEQLLHKGLLSSEMSEKCGLKTSDASILDEEGISRDFKIRAGNKTQSVTDLAAANDSGSSFRVIATWIEKNYKKL